MGLLRYTASADNTIVNGYELDLTTRGTASNAGASDILEAYSMYGRINSSSQELSRVLIKFPTSKITADRAAGTIPAQGSVSFYLRMFNAEHSRTVPIEYKMIVSAVSQSWEEGVGLDLNGYKDPTLGNIGSNWIARTGDKISEITRYVFSSVTPSDYGAAAGANYVKVYNGTSRYNFWFDDGAGDSAPSADGTEERVSISGLSATATIAEAFKAAADGLSDFSANRIGSTVYVTASTAGPSTAVGVEGTIAPLDVRIYRTGSNETPWAQPSLPDPDGISPVPGAVFSTASGETYTQHFSNGIEDLEINITALVEKWLAGTSTSGDNYGVGVMLSGAYEAAATAEAVALDSNVVLNADGATKSYYTKRFFGRGSQYFFKRPVIEARWDSSIRDDRGNAFFSSSRASGPDNLNTIYFYNMVRGRLTNLPNISTNYGTYDSWVRVSVYSSSAGQDGPSGPAILLHNASTPTTVVTGGYVSTGIYSCSLCFTKSNNLVTLYDVWFSGSTMTQPLMQASSSTRQFFTGTLEPELYGTGVSSVEPRYYCNISNLKNKYYHNEKARLNLYAREKNWSPNIYTIANNSIDSIGIRSASYGVVRLIDNAMVIPYGTGSDFHTGLSYNVSGNYFDFDMKLLEPGFAYGFKFAFHDDRLGSWTEQEQTFKFWLEER
jgi:hypothetical protein